MQTCLCWLLTVKWKGAYNKNSERLNDLEGLKHCKIESGPCKTADDNMNTSLPGNHAIEDG